MTETKQVPAPATPPDPSAAAQVKDEAPAKIEHGGPKGLEPTRFGDWERNGRCYDF